jgi:hypothetical protein
MSTYHCDRLQSRKLCDQFPVTCEFDQTKRTCRRKTPKAIAERRGGEYFETLEKAATSHFAECHPIFQEDPSLGYACWAAEEGEDEVMDLGCVNTTNPVTQEPFRTTDAIVTLDFGGGRKG